MTWCACAIEAVYQAGFIRSKTRSLPDPRPFPACVNGQGFGVSGMDFCTVTRPLPAGPACVFVGGFGVKGRDFLTLKGDGPTCNAVFNNSQEKTW
jgi:hypothetical protein